MAKPVQPMEYVETRIRQEKYAVFSKIVFRDATGKLWAMQTAQFTFDMRPLEEIEADVDEGVYESYGKVEE